MKLTDPIDDIQPSRDYLEPWDQLNPADRWRRAEVWQGTPGNVLVIPPLSHRPYRLRGTILGPGSQRFSSMSGDVLVVDVNPGPLETPELHVVPLIDIERISEWIPSDDEPAGKDERFSL